MSNFSWNDYLEFAKYIKENSIQSISEEANYRVGISRAYYAAYNCATNYAQESNFQLPGDKSEWHREIPKSLKSNSSTQGLGLKLGKLRQKRNKADYHAEQEIKKRELTTCISWANHIRQELN